MRAAIVGAVALGASLIAAPAGAAGYDPSGLCTSPTPTLEQVNAAAATIRRNTDAAIRKAGGVTVHQVGQADSWSLTGTVTVDVRDRRSRADSVLLSADDFVNHSIVDGASSSSYDGHFAADARYQPVIGKALKILGRKRVWVRNKLPHAEVTRQAIIDEAAGSTELTVLEPWTGDDTAPTYTYTCTVLDGALQVVETSTEDSTDTEVVTIGFTAKGAMAWVSSDYTDGGRYRRDDLSYGRRTVKAPKHSNIISFKRWIAAVKKATG